MSKFFETGPLTATGADGRLLFREVTLSLKESTLTLLTGPSGCGKTTLLKMAGGLLPAPGAKRYLSGSFFSEEALHLWRSRVLLMMQDAPVLQGSVEQNLSFPYLFQTASGKKFHKGQAERLMEAVGLGHVDLDHDASSLSGGERHRLVLVRALLWSPDVILADEPLSGLDRENARHCFRLLSDFARSRGKAVCCVMHDTGYEELADRIISFSGATVRYVQNTSAALKFTASVSE